LDDAVIIPASVFAALRFAAHELVSEGREQAARNQAIPYGDFGASWCFAVRKLTEKAS